MSSYLVIGLGRFGSYVAKTLGEYGQEVMAVDSNEANLNSVLPYVTNGLIGDPTNEAFLRSLGIKNYDAVFLNISHDIGQSLMICYLLKEMGAKHVVAKAASAIHEKLLLKNGADQVTYPEKDLAGWIGMHYSSDKLHNLYQFNSEYDVIDVKIPDKWIGKSLKELRIKQEYQVVILGLYEDEAFQMMLNAQKKLEKGMRVLAMGKRADIKRCFNI